MIEHLSNLRDEAGQTMAEYAVVLAVITIACVTALALLSTKIEAAIKAVTTAIG